MLERAYVIIEMFSIVLCLYALYGKRFKISLYTSTLTVVVFAIIYAINIGKLDTTASVVTYLLIFIYSVVEFKSDIRKACINNVLYIIIISIVQLVCAFPVMLIARFGIDDATKGLIINSAVLVLVIVFKSRIEKISMYVNSKQWLARISVGCCFVLIVVMLSRHKFLKELPGDIYVICCALILLAIVLVLKWQESRLQVRQKQLELEMTNVYNRTFEQLLSNVRKKQHDINNHFNAIYSQHYIYKTYDELVTAQKKYCDELEADFKYDELLKLNIPVLGGFLYSKFQEINSKGIGVISEIRLYSKEIGIPIYELISILGILLDNALEACDEAETSHIFFSIEENEKSIDISVKNKCDYIHNNEIIKMFEDGYSSKDKDRGIGLCNVKEKSYIYDFDIAVENVSIEGENWVCFKLIIKK